MKNQINKILFSLLIIFSCIACSNSSKKQGAVIFSFDDQLVESWINAQPLFDKYDIKATFFVCRPHLLDSMQISWLKQLSSYGHEIDCHGMNHINVETYLDSFDIYVEKEILPAIDLLKGMGFAVNSFAYPFGASTNMTDSILSKHFSYLRKATWNMNDTTINQYNEIFINKDHRNITNAMGIDNNYNISLESIETGIVRAKENNEIIVLYAHRIADMDTDYSVKPSYLEEVFKLCKKHNVKTITFDEIETFF